MRGRRRSPRVEQVKQDLKGWRLSRCVFVGDAGMVSQENLSTLARGGGRYIVAMPVHSGGEVEREVLSRPGRYRAVAANLKVKEVTEAGHSKRVCQLRASGRYGRYLRLTPSGRPVIDAARVRAAERLDGKFVVHSNDDTLTAEDMALGYKQLQRVEEAWRGLKSGLKLCPVFHWAPHRIHAHVALTVLALLLERMAEQACQDTWRNIRDDLKQIKLAQLSSPHGDVWQVSEPAALAANRLKSLKIPQPPPILKLL